MVPISIIVGLLILCTYVASKNVLDLSISHASLHAWIECLLIS